MEELTRYERLRISRADSHGKYYFFDKDKSIYAYHNNKFYLISTDKTPTFLNNVKGIDLNNRFILNYSHVGNLSIDVSSHAIERIVSRSGIIFKNKTNDYIINYIKSSIDNSKSKGSFYLMDDSSTHYVWKYFVFVVRGGIVTTIMRRNKLSEISLVLYSNTKKAVPSILVSRRIKELL